MIKAGDKVVCMQEHIFYRGGGTDMPLTHKQGKCYEVFKYDTSDETVYINAEEQYAPDVHGLWFNLNHCNNGDRSFLRNYFITLAEWRDKQINSILDESTDGK
jgi:hypothetical protein